MEQSIIYDESIHEIQRLQLEMLRHTRHNLLNSEAVVRDLLQWRDLWFSEQNEPRLQDVSDMISRDKSRTDAINLVPTKTPDRSTNNYKSHKDEQ